MNFSLRPARKGEIITQISLLRLPVRLLVPLLFGCGVLLSLRCGFPQLRPRRVLRDLRSALRHGGEDGGLPPFQAMTTALAGTVGTGNIAGVTGAILLGGPGAVFWMWVAAFFGMCTKYAEIALALRYRSFGADGLPRGGPMYYIEFGLGPALRPLALFFALGGGLAALGVGNLTQGSEIAGAVHGLTGLPPLLTGLLLSAVTAAVLFAGARGVGRATALLVPLMAGLYLLCVLPILALHAAELPALLLRIVRGAFSARAAGGGLCGSAIRFGFARGLFSNEAGLGSAPMAHASSACGEPRVQAAWGIFEVFFDSFLVCTATALVVLLAGPVGGSGADGYGAMAADAFRRLLPGSETLVCVSLIFFALSSMLAWGRYGELCWSYLLRGKAAAAPLFRLVFVLVCPLGALWAGQLIWELSDLFNAMMALPNLAALLLLSGRAASIARAEQAAPPCAGRAGSDQSWMM